VLVSASWLDHPPVQPFVVRSDPYISGFREFVAGPSGDYPMLTSTTGGVSGFGLFDGALFCEPHGAYPYDEGMQDAVDSPLDASGDPVQCHAWQASPTSLGLLVLNPRTPGTNPADDLPPTAPADIGVTVRDTTVVLTWQPSLDDTGVVGYEIYRDGVWIATVNANNSSYEDPVLPFTAHHYAIVAIDGFGNHSAGATEDVVTQLAGFDGGGPGA